MRTGAPPRAIDSAGKSFPQSCSRTSGSSMNPRSKVVIPSITGQARRSASLLLRATSRSATLA